MEICNGCGGFITSYSIHSCGPTVGEKRVCGDGSVDVWTGDTWTKMVPAGPGRMINAEPIVFESPIDGLRTGQLSSSITKDQHFQDLVAKAIGGGMKSAAEARAQFLCRPQLQLQPGRSMHELTEAIAKIRESEVAAEERWYEGKLGALGAVLRRRPIRLDCRSEVVSYLHETFAASVPVESWRSGAYYGGTSISVDDELEPGVVRAHFYAHPDAGPQGLIRTDEIVIGELGD